MNIQSPIQLPDGLTIDAFFGWVERQAERYELVEGTPRLQPWVKRNHSKIASNLAFLLQTMLDRSRFDIHQGDFAIQTGPSSIRYADVLVEPSGGPGDGRTADHACLIVEILSPSTSSDDFGPKREEYLGLPGLRSYLIVAQDECRAWLWTRDRRGEWPHEPVVLNNGAASIVDLGIALPLSQIYAGVAFTTS